MPPDGQAGSWDTSAYVNFDVVGGTVDRIVLDSTSPAFETDNHAFLGTPEPSSLLMIGLGGILLAAGRVRIVRQRKSS
jgi:hypothetical protein